MNEVKTEILALLEEKEKMINDLLNDHGNTTEIDALDSQMHALWAPMALMLTEAQ